MLTATVDGNICIKFTIFNKISIKSHHKLLNTNKQVLLIATADLNLPYLTKSYTVTNFYLNCQKHLPLMQQTDSPKLPYLAKSTLNQILNYHIFNKSYHI